MGTVLDFFARNGTEDRGRAPELLIELFFTSNDNLFQPLRGVHNSLDLDAPGVAVRAFPAEDYRAEFAAYLWCEYPQRAAETSALMTALRRRRRS